MRIAGDIQKLGKQRDDHDKTASGLKKQIEEMGTFGMSFEHFYGLQEDPDVDSALLELEQRLEAAKRRDEVEEADLLTELHLPDLSLSSVDDLLNRTIDDLDRAAADHVQEVALKLGGQGEQWLSKGAAAMFADHGSYLCPFCRQSVQGLTLVEHYRAYFGNAYRKLKQEIDDEMQALDRSHGSGARANVDRAMLQNAKLQLFWRDFCDLEETNIENSDTVELWQRAITAVKDLLVEKQRSPLEQVKVNRETREEMEQYHSATLALEEANKSIAKSNAEIARVKETVKREPVSSVENELRERRAIRARYQPEYLTVLESHRKEQEAKSLAVEKLEKAKVNLEEHRKKRFTQHEHGVNQYLAKFGAGFRLREFTYQDRCSGPTSRYDLDILNTAVPVRAETRRDDIPAFDNTLSAGDRATLALSFFFESTKGQEDLAELTVVVDDPASSLDEQRSAATIEELIWLGGKARQVIVLSHNRYFLAKLWERRSESRTTALRLKRQGDASVFEEWDVAKEAETDHDARFALFRRYQEAEHSDKRVVAQALRPHLERFLRVAYPGEFPAGHTLRTFMAQSGKVLNEGDVRELRELIRFGNRYHHDTNISWETEPISDSELSTYVGRVMRFTRR